VSGAADCAAAGTTGESSRIERKSTPRTVFGGRDGEPFGRGIMRSRGYGRLWKTGLDGGDIPSDSELSTEGPPPYAGKEQKTKGK
jgi:hypothetical protein